MGLDENRRATALIVAFVLSSPLIRAFFARRMASHGEILSAVDRTCPQLGNGGSSFAFGLSYTVPHSSLILHPSPSVNRQRRTGCVGKKMHLKALLPLVSLLAFSWVPDTARAAEPTAAGLWEKRDNAGKSEGWFRVADRNGAYEGQIVRMFPKPGEDPASWRCTKCEGEQKDAPVLGITFIKGMKRQGLAYEDGTILDPRDGSAYSARMDLSPDGQQLSVRGYLGISLLGRTEVWTRLPDNALNAEQSAGSSQRRDNKASAKTR